MASLEYDASAKAFYVMVRNGRIAETEPVSDSIFLDLDLEGQLLGMEAVLPKDLPQDTLDKIANATD